MANAVPSGAPMTNAQALAVRLTASDSTTMSRKLESKLTMRPTAVRSASAKSFMPHLSDLTYLAVQRSATRPKTLAYVIDVNFEVEKQIGMPYRHAQIVGCLIDALQFGLKRIELRGGKVCLQTCLDSPEPLIQSAHAIASDPAAQLGRNI